jgi:hypothetical protein
VNKTWAHLLRQKELWKQKALQKFGNNVTEKKNDPLLAALTGIASDRPRSDLDRLTFYYRKRNYSRLATLLFIEVIVDYIRILL